MERDDLRQPPLEPEILEDVPIVERTTTQLERSFGPNCLLSLVIVLLLLLLVKRFVHVSWPVLLCFTIIIWFMVLTLLVRWRPIRVVEED